MTKETFIVFLLGLGAGALLAFLAVRAHLLARLEAMETRLHERFSAFEATVAQHLHRSAPAAPAARPVDATTPAAPGA